MSALVTDAISDYLVSHAPLTDSEEAIRHRLIHIVTYIGTLVGVPKCDQIDETWISGFRKWAAKQPIVSKTGKVRERSVSTIENSVLQLAAVINWARGRGMTLNPARFKPSPPRTVNRTPQYRADLSDLARMFSYAAAPSHSVKRLNLLRFLRLTFATLARPDAAHDFSTDTKRDQWNSARRIANLNPKGRRQTRKVRAIVPVIERVGADLDQVSGFYIPINSVKSAFETMMIELGMPGDGQSGMKLVRRSVADILRNRLPVAQHVEITIMLGHSVFDDVSELYAPFRPDYLTNVRNELDRMADEIEKTVPGAFYHSFTAQKAPLRVVGGQ